MQQAARVLVLATSLSGCRPPDGPVSPDTTPAHAVAPGPDRAPRERPGQPPVLSLLAPADRDALVAAGEPTIETAPVLEDVATTLVLRVGASSIVLTRATWARDRCESFSVHYEILAAAHGLVDARINCHFGEDFWTTEVAADLVVIDVAKATVRSLWSGTESYEGAMGECTIADGAIAYERVGATMRQSISWWASWEPQDPSEPLVPKTDCVSARDVGIETDVATLAAR